MNRAQIHMAPISGSKRGRSKQKVLVPPHPSNIPPKPPGKKVAQQDRDRLIEGDLPKAAIICMRATHTTHTLPSPPTPPPTPPTPHRPPTPSTIHHLPPTHSHCHPHHPPTPIAGGTRRVRRRVTDGNLWSVQAVARSWKRRNRLQCRKRTRGKSMLASKGRRRRRRRG